MTAEQYRRILALADKAPQLLEMQEGFERGRWLGRLLFKLSIGVGGTVAAVATFKENVISLLGGAP